MPFKLAADTYIAPILELENPIADETLYLINTITRSGLCTDISDNQNTFNEFFDSDNEYDDENLNNLENSKEFPKLDDHLIFDDKLTHDQTNTLIIHRKYGHSGKEKTKQIIIYLKYELCRFSL